VGSSNRDSPALGRVHPVIASSSAHVDNAQALHIWINAIPVNATYVTTQIIDGASSRPASHMRFTRNQTFE
jgi:hypothetical protein